jgi:membrane protease YdiL (CAAX protease family)
MRRHPVVWFYILAFGISWLGWLPMTLGSRGWEFFNNPSFQFLLILPAIGPMLAAVIVTRAAYGKAKVDALFRALVQWRVGLVWYVVAVFGPLALFWLGQVATPIFGGTTLQLVAQGDLVPIALSALIMSLLSNPWEEVGWRGFALPHLQQRYTALVATLIVGVLWGIWHLPLFFWVGNPMSTYSFLPWFIGTVAGATIYTWLYNSTRGSLLVATLFHVALNTFGVIVSGVSIQVLAILYCLVALALVIVFGDVNLSRRERVRAEGTSL